MLFEENARTAHDLMKPIKFQLKNGWENYLCDLAVLHKLASKVKCLQKVW